MPRKRSSKKKVTDSVNYYLEKKWGKECMKNPHLKGFISALVASEYEKATK